MTVMLGHVGILGSRFPHDTRKDNAVILAGNIPTCHEFNDVIRSQNPTQYFLYISYFAEILKSRRGVSMAQLLFPQADVEDMSSQCARRCGDPELRTSVSHGQDVFMRMLETRN